MSANRSSAVMQQRVEAHDSLDDFPTPPWATRALLRILADHGEALHLQHAWEPACNRGQMARVLKEEFDQVFATDVHDYGWQDQDGVADFLVDWSADAPDVDWVITNPPFRLGVDFINQGLRVARRGVAVFTRTAFVEGQERYEVLFRKQPETLFCPFVERVVIWKGVLLDPDVPVWYPATESKPAHSKKPPSATSYAWLVWMKDAPHDLARAPGRVVRIPPCRAALTRANDYPPLPAHLRPPDGALL